MLKPRQKLRAPDSQPRAHFIDSLPGFEKKNGGQFMIGKCLMTKGSNAIRGHVIRGKGVEDGLEEVYNESEGWLFGPPAPGL